MPEAVLPRSANADANDNDNTEVPDASVRHVFVYGTLRRGGDNDITRLLPAPRFVGQAKVCGVMHDLGAYPGVILGGGKAATDIVGEVFAIEPTLERILDEIEELYPQQRDEYFKRHIRVHTSGVGLTCIVYEINPAYAFGKPVIASGDWLANRTPLTGPH